ncbi:MAG: hypothetical protein JSU96_07590 [Acidobacteriota bacterium]|nr:MAG: hypothetical protein JSU96_07590 [Acidobacteriota bacterium]
MSKKMNRRSMIGKSLGVSAGVAAGMSYEHQALLAQLVDRSGWDQSKQPVTSMERGKLGDREVSRLIIGGNLMSGSAHAGELLYQSQLMTHYFTDEKIQETWRIAQQNSINTTLMRADPHIVRNYRAYCKDMGDGLQWIAQSAPEQGDPVENAKMARDNGAFAVYFHGGRGDNLIEAGKVDDLGEIVEGMKKTGILAGVGGHKLETIKASEKAGLNPDFYMYTVNKVDYLSSDPGEIESFMAGVKQPWIGFKVLGAGRDTPLEGFRHAFSRGADFLAVGMFDWQVRDDAEMIAQMLETKIDRQRRWRA